MPEGFEKRRTKRPHLFDFIYGSLSQLAEENGSNPFKFRFESEVNYHYLNEKRIYYERNNFVY